MTDNNREIIKEQDCCQTLLVTFDIKIGSRQLTAHKICVINICNNVLLSREKKENHQNYTLLVHPQCVYVQVKSARLRAD